jgi:DNA-binding GntR family transcriptional regulator
MVIAKMDVSQLLSMWELLAEMEGVCARLACERMSASERAELKRSHNDAQRIADANDMDAWKGANLTFHEVLYAGSRNPYLRQEILRMRARTGAYRDHAFAALGNIGASWDQHADVLAAILGKDPVAAHGTMVKHLSPGQGARGFASFLAALPKQLLD